MEIKQLSLAAGDLSRSSRETTSLSLRISGLEAGFSFEAGGRTFRPVVCHSTSGTLRSTLAFFFTTVLYIFLTKASHEHTD